MYQEIPMAVNPAKAVPPSGNISQNSPARPATLNPMRSVPLEVPPLHLGDAVLRVEHWQRSRGRSHNGGWIELETPDGHRSIPLYTVDYDPQLEEDVQDIFILRLEADPPAAIDEVGRKFHLCLATGTVTHQESDPWPQRFARLSDSQAFALFHALQQLQAPPDPFGPDPFAADPFAPDPFAAAPSSTIDRFTALPHSLKRSYWQVCWADMAPGQWQHTAAMLWGCEFPYDDEEEPISSPLDPGEQLRDQIQRRLMEQLLDQPDLPLRASHQSICQQLGLPPHPESLYQAAADFVEQHYREAPKDIFADFVDAQEPPLAYQPPHESAEQLLALLDLPLSLEGPQAEYHRSLCLYYLQRRLAPAPMTGW